MFILKCIKEFTAGREERLKSERKKRERNERQVSKCDDNDYAFQLLQDIYAIRGGQIILEEFDPEKHVKGYKPNI